MVTIKNGAAGLPSLFIQFHENNTTSPALCAPSPIEDKKKGRVSEERKFILTAPPSPLFQG
jgi:hypothetical protein